MAIHPVDLLLGYPGGTQWGGTDPQHPHRETCFAQRAPRQFTGRRRGTGRCGTGRRNSRQRSPGHRRLPA